MKECLKCGTCCIAPPISHFNKPAGVPCRHLTADNLCGIHETRPQVCRDYSPWELCDRVQEGKDLDERMRIFLRAYNMESFLDTPCPNTGDGAVR